VQLAFCCKYSIKFIRSSCYKSCNIVSRCMATEFKYILC